MPGLKSTCTPGMRSRMVFASGERSSLMRIRSILYLVYKAVLRRRQARPELHFRAQIMQPALDRADHHQHVEVVEIPKVRDAEDLPLRRVLAADQLDPVFGEEMLDQLFRVDSLGRKHGGHGRAGTLRVE